MILFNLLYRNSFSFSIISLIIVPTIFFSCKKPAGEGGSATIKGKLLCGNYNSPETPVSSDDGASDERVYIIYGDNSIAGNNERTMYDGSFEFKFLRKGTYKIFAYSLDKNSKIPVETIVEKTIEITKKNEIAEVSDFIIYKKADKGGNSTIKGKVFLRGYNPDFTQLKYSYYKAEEDVYIVFGNDTIYDERTRTSYDGSFQFEGLRKGTYKIYAFSKDSAKIYDCYQIGGNCTIFPDSAVIRTIEITSGKQEIILPDIVILKN